MSATAQSARITISEAIDEINSRLHQHLNRVINVWRDVLGHDEETGGPSPLPPTSLDSRVFDLLGVISSIESEFASVVMRLGVDTPKPANLNGPQVTKSSQGSAYYSKF